MNLLQRPLDGLTALLLGLLLIPMVFFPHLMSSDAALYLEMGEKLLDGQRPYVDYEEINLPMIHVLSAVPALLGRLMDIAPHHFFHVLVYALLIASVLSVRHLTQHRTRREMGQVLGLVLVIMAVGQQLFFDWGQREHLFMLLFVPWLVLRDLRRADQPLGWGLALGLGIAAGIGLSLKPHFALIGLAVELVAVIRTRRWAFRKPEVAGVGLVAGLYVVYLVANPDVLIGLIRVLQSVQAGYGAYPSTALPVFFSQTPAALLSLLLLIGVLVVHFVRPTWFGEWVALSWAFTATGVTGFTMFLLQGKGWGYHAIPFYTGTALTVAMLVTIGGERWARSAPQKARRWSGVLVVFIPLMALSYQVLRSTQISPSAGVTVYSVLSAVIQRYSAPGDRVMLVDTNPDTAYPLLPANQRRHASRYAVAHPIGFAYYRYNGLPYDNPAHVVPPYAQRYLDHFVEDVRTHRPPLVIVRDSPCSACSLYLLSLHDYLDARGILAEVIEPDYDLLAVDEGFHIYVRKGLTPNP